MLNSWHDSRLVPRAFENGNKTRRLVANLKFLKLKANVRLYFCLTGFACSHFLARAFHQLTFNAIINSSCMAITWSCKACNCYKISWLNTYKKVCRCEQALFLIFRWGLGTTLPLEFTDYNEKKIRLIHRFLWKEFLKAICGTGKILTSSWKILTNEYA